MYGLGDGNTTEARRLYQVRFPNRVTQDMPTFSNIHRRLSETDSFTTNNHLKGATQTMRTPDIEEAVLHCIDLNHHVSTRKIGNQLNISQVLVWRILHNFLLYPFYIQRVQTLLPRDFPSRLNFCRWFLDKIRENAHFDSEIMFTEESNFSRTAITNLRKNHYWAEETPHLIEESHHQKQYSLNVWVGMIGNYLIGQFFLLNRLNGSAYRQFLEEELPLLLKD
ncbi:hypothetical protein HHI36_014084 [Cryptolaemus montrouzieri]|uniref:DUF4817 domain-containing protein n=1 Tax=Cryptolaemus montrouzieri TaxID=559131 RepID=A0ABD2N2B9_9CUCU